MQLDQFIDVWKEQVNKVSRDPSLITHRLIEYTLKHL